MASSWGRLGLGPLLILITLPQDLVSEVHAADVAPALGPVAPADPFAVSLDARQGALTRIFDTSLIGDTLGEEVASSYVNDHTLVQDRQGAWHLFGIWHAEPFAPEQETEFVHAVAREPDPLRWGDGAFEIAARPFTTALIADGEIGETHIWAPHVVFAEGRYVMVYQGGGVDRDRSSIRLAESEDLYQWTRVSTTPLFEDICEARDPMLTKRDNAWVLYYTRCESTTSRINGVAYRLSRDLLHWTEPRMVLSLDDAPRLSNSGYTESPFVFERQGYFYLSVTSYPLAFNATMIYRSLAPFAFPSAPLSRVRGHAGEWVTSRDGRRIFMTHAGPGQRGVLMSPIEALDESPQRTRDDASSSR